MKNMHQLKPLISIILPVYNIENYLDKCMDSLFVQTYKNIELVMVDDGSTDKSAFMCDMYADTDPRVRVFHKTNGGLSDARNYGISRAKGEYITCVDPDDYVDADYIEYLWRLIEDYGTKMSICQHRVVFKDKILDYGRSQKSEVMNAQESIEKMLYHDVIDTSAWAKLYHKSLFRNIEYPYGRLFEDIATTYKLMIESETIAVGYESKYSYCCREDSIVNRTFSEKKLDLLDMTDEMATTVIKTFPRLINAAKRRQVYARFSTLNQMIGVSGVEETRKHIINYIKANSAGVLKDRKTPRRDKFAILSLMMGYHFYEQMWIRYKKRQRG